MADNEDRKFPKFLTPEELSARLGAKISVRQLCNWRCEGRGPAYLRIGRILYPIKELEEWEKGEEKRMAERALQIENEERASADFIVLLRSRLNQADLDQCISLANVANLNVEALELARDTTPPPDERGFGQ